MSGHYTPDDLAARLGVTRRWVMTHHGEFPHLKVGPYVRFTQAHVEQIEKALEVNPTKGDNWGRKTKRTA